MIRNPGRRRVARFVLAAGAVTATTVTVLAGTASAGTAFAGTAFAGAVPVPAAGDVLRAGATDAIGDRYIVVLKPGSAEAGRVTSASVTLARRYGGSVRRNFVATVRGFTVDMPAAAARRLAADPAVQYVEQDRVVRPAGTQLDPAWGLDRVDQRTLPLSRSYTSGAATGVTAYVLDTGIRTSHAEFGGRAVDGWDFIDRDPVAEDCNGHGTHVAGTIGGSTYGVAKDVTLVGVRVLDCQGSGSYSQIIAGVDWVTAHATGPAVANMSLGGDPSTALDDAVNRSIAKGVTYAVAAGNDNKLACSASPARAAAAITVGATDRADARAAFSNYGSCLDIFAPGARIVSAGTVSDTAVVSMSGTSMAAPHVAGAAALVLGALPQQTPAQVRETLVARATPGVVIGPGAGSPNRLLWTGWLHPAPALTPAETGVAAPPSSPTPAPTTPAPTTPAPTTPAPTTPAPTTPAPTTPETTPPTTPPAACGPFTDSRAVAVPDVGTASTARAVTTCAGGASSTSAVHVRISHPYRGSLSVTLVAPNGTTYLLKAANVNDKAADVIATYPVPVAGLPRNGTWTLRVNDRYRGGVGRLSSWALRL
jgi:subtilisin family serine protease